MRAVLPAIALVAAVAALAQNASAQSAPVQSASEAPSQPAPDASAPSPAAPPAGQVTIGTPSTDSTASNSGQSDAPGAPVVVVARPRRPAPYTTRAGESPEWWRYRAVVYGNGAMPYGGGAIPPGTRIEQRANGALVGAGAVTLGVLYGLTALLAVASVGTPNAGMLLIPLVGPAIFIGVSGPASAPGLGVEIVSVVGQLAGVAMIVTGLALSRPWVALAPRDASAGLRRPTVRFAIGAPGALLGASATALVF